MPIVLLALVGLVAAATLPSCSRGMDSSLLAIYGEDDRSDLTDPAVTTTQRQLARSTALLVLSSDVEESPEEGFSRLKATSLGAAYNLCPSERFRDQPNPGHCSGFLVGEDIIATAGHCLYITEGCAGIKVVFDFHATEGKDITMVSDENVYACESIVAKSPAEDADLDFALIRLDRAPKDRPVLQFRREGDVVTRQALFSIGNPSGLPTKVSRVGEVRQNDLGKPFFVTNLDHFKGSSGSAVFNAGSTRVEGIAIRGEGDYVRSPEADCDVVRRCEDDECRGEEVTRASAIIPFLPQEVRENLRSVIVEMSERPRLLIADGGRKSFIQEFQVASDGIVADVAVALKITHPMAGDLVIRLRHPDGDVAVLHDRDGWTADLDRVYGEKGAVIPKLRTFRGRSALGTWQILIENHSDGANGFLERAKLEIKLQD